MITPEDGIISQVGLSTKKLNASDAVINRVEKLDKVYKTGIRNWLASNTIDKMTVDQLSYEDVDKTIENFDSEVAASIFQDWSKQAELSLELINKIEQLKAIQPVNQSVTLFGVDDHPPSLFEQKKWLMSIRIFDNPKSLLDSLNAGLLSGIEVEAMGMVYPSILETLQQALVEGIAELKGKGIKGLGMKKMRLVNILLQVPRLSPEQFETLQAQYMGEEEGTDINVDGEAVQTDTQRVQYRNQ